MQASHLVFATLLLAGTALAGRELQQTAQTSCFARGNLKIFIKSGSCSGWAGGSCAAFASADAVIKDKTRTAFSTALCKPAEVRLAATAIAEAVSSVHTSALAKIKCTGQGFGCGFGVSGGSAFATAFADAAVEAATVAINADKNLVAVCHGDIRSIAVAITRAFSSSFGQACTNGPGAAAAFQTNFAKALSDAIAKAFIRATAKVCDLPGADTAVCRLDGSGSATTDDSVTTGGGGVSTPPIGGGSANNGGFSGGSAGQLDFCSKPAFATCCALKSVTACGTNKIIASLNPRYDTVLADAAGKSLCWCH